MTDSRKIGYLSDSGRAELVRLMRARRPGETIRDVERRERRLAISFVPKELCGDGGCVFLPGHESEHSWGGAS